MTTGRIVLYLATSVDGFVAAEDGSVEWLEEFESESDAGGDGSGYEAFFADVDALVMGSTTYEQVLSFGEWPYGEKPAFVLTRRDLDAAVDAVEFVDDDVGALATRLKRRYDRVWLVGGAQVARAFLRERQVDELRLTLAPVLLGGGIPLFGESGTEARLTLIESTTREGGLVELRYGIEF